jgi:hypothetical protein
MSLPPAQAGTDSAAQKRAPLPHAFPQVVH